MEYKYTVYQHVFPNGKVYVGLTRQKIYDRWGSNGYGYKNQPLWIEIEKYGWDNIKHEIIADNLDVDAARKMEQNYIKKYQADNCSLNIMPGGDLGSDLVRNILIDGQLYTSEEVAKMSSVDGITGHDITTRINHHRWSIQKAVTKDKMPKNQKYLYNGKEYTANELEKFSNDISTEHIRDRLAKGWTVERALFQPTNVKKQPFGTGDRIYEYQGRLYNSYELTQIYPELNLKSQDITTRINAHGWSIEKAISTPKKKRGIIFEYNNIQYDSHELANICTDPTMTYHDVTDRYRIGWSVWEIVNIPKGITRKQFYNNN